MPKEPEVDITTHLGTNTSLTAGTDLFEFAPVPPDDKGMPAKAVFVFPAGGGVPEMHLEPTATDLLRSVVQVRIRSSQADFAGGADLAREVRDALKRATITGYVWIRLLQSHPEYIGPDDRGSHEWSLNIEAATEE